MSVVYSKLLKNSVEKINAELTLLEKSLDYSQAPESQDRVALLSIVQRIKVLGGFFGFQKITDILSWMEEYLMKVEADKSLWVHAASVLPLSLDILKDIVDTVELPKDYGEFIKSSGVAIRPLFSRTVPVQPLFEKIRAVLPLNLSSRSIYKLPVSMGEEFTFTLKVPSRFLEENKEYPGFLSIIFIDIGRQESLPWERPLDDFQFWTRQGAFIYQGALELPYDRLNRKTNILPYYVLLKSINHPSDFLAVNQIIGHPMKILKTPEEEIAFIPPDIPEDSRFEDGEVEEKSDNDEPRAGLESFSTQPGDWLEETHEELFSPFEPVTDDKELVTPNTFPDHYHEELAQVLGKLPPVVVPEAVSKSTPNFISLSSIPFTISDLESPGFQWPRGPLSVNVPELLKNAQVPEQDLPTVESSEVQVEDLNVSEAELLKEKLALSEEPKPKKKKSRGLSISFKLIGIISLVIVSSLSLMIAIASTAFFADTTVRIEENYQKVSEVLALSLSKNLRAQGEKSKLFLEFMTRTPEDQKKSRMDSFFATEQNIVFTGVIKEGTEFFESYQQGEFFSDHKITIEKIQAFLLGEKDRLEKSAGREFLVTNASFYLGHPTLAISFPVEREGQIHPLLVFLDTEKSFMDLVKMAGISTTVVLNEKGELLIHPDLTELQNSKKYANLDFIKKIAESKLTNNKVEYQLPGTTVNLLGYFWKVPDEGITVLTSVDQSKAFEAAYQVLFRNLLLLAMAVSLSILIVLFFSKTIINPIQALVTASRLIREGDFNIKLKPRVRDELGILNESFEEMSHGLAEREKLKDAFGKFVNKEIAELVSKGEVKLGGERKTATIFFSDIRSFTAISEKLLPEEVVEFLNQYMTRMVSIVNQTHGNVDKFIGDAIMAVWGTPISFGNDAENAVDAALQMRRSLLEFNRDRGDEKHPIIRIGCGINTGSVLAGQIGSDERMEYTVIGDAVNLASRIEALNKPFGTDVLISSDTYGLVKDRFKTVPMQPIKVKGKSEPQLIFCVLGRKDDPMTPNTIEDLRRILQIEGSFGDVDLDKEEVKYEILNQSQNTESLAK